MSQILPLLDVLVIALLAATLPMAWRLDRQLRALRADRAALEAGAAGLAEATRAAEAVLARLAAASEAAERGAQERLARAGAVQEDLRYLAERAEAIADRLEAAVQAGRPLAGGAGAPVGPALRSDAERELLRALGRVS
ncbi:MAG: DUF6468 domain-containing protein [Roseococcus sp.]|nr:DUF6468 domain-containing protein [Roseococcus sp.]